MSNSAISPSFRTSTLFESRMVLIRWAMVIMVRSLNMLLLKVDCSRASVSMSTAACDDDRLAQNWAREPWSKLAVASSRTRKVIDLSVSQAFHLAQGRGRSLPRMFVGVKRARASETSCRWPWLRLLPVPDACYYMPDSCRVCTTHHWCMRQPRGRFSTHHLRKAGLPEPLA